MRILLGCSETLFSGFLEHRLRGEGVETIRVDNPRALRTALHNDYPVLLFVQMPHVSMTEVTEWVRAIAPDRRPLLYVLSWSHDEQQLRRWYEMGVDEYFTLPVEMTRLMRHLKRRVELQARYEQQALVL